MSNIDTINYYRFLVSTEAESMAYLLSCMAKRHERMLALRLDSKKFQDLSDKDNSRQNELARKSIDICIKVLQYEIELIDNLLGEEIPNYGQ